MIEINTYGIIFHYNKNNLKHRGNDLPAMEYSNGTKYHYKNGLKHRVNGLPAVTWNDVNGSVEFWEYWEFHKWNLFY